MNSRIKFRLAAAASLFCAPLAAMATVTVSTDTTWSSGSYSEAAGEHSDASLILNATPCGMFPDVSGTWT